MDDAQLVQRAATGDTAALARVYDRYAGRLHDYLWWVLQDRDQADDALYDTFIEAAARADQLVEPERLRTWLFAIASRQALAGRHRPAPASSTPAPPTGAGASWGELVEVVRAVGEQLPARDRAILDLRCRQGFDDDDLADILGASPSQAGPMADRLTHEAEEALAENVVAYLGRQDCDELAGVLVGAGAILTASERRLVSEHAWDCPTCGPRRRRHLAAGTLMRVGPAGPPSPEIAGQVLEGAELASHRGRPWPARRGGFPPPLPMAGPRRWPVAVAAALVLVLGAGALIATRDDGGGERVAAVGTTVAVPTTTSRATTTVAPTTTMPEGDEGEPDGSTTTGRPIVVAGTGGAGTGGTGGGGGGPGTGGGGTGGGNTGTTATTVATTTTTTTTVPPDVDGPSLTGLSVSPSTVRPNGTCTNADPMQTTVTVTASDPSGVSSVTAMLSTDPESLRTMTASGAGSYSATLGPFKALNAHLQEIALPVLVSATDGAGNESITSVRLTLRCTT
ncbi:MAG: hypothetical protein AB1673_10225 [Actinomycetota bacterium]